MSPYGPNNPANKQFVIWQKRECSEVSENLPKNYVSRHLWKNYPRCFSVILKVFLKFQGRHWEFSVIFLDVCEKHFQEFFSDDIQILPTTVTEFRQCLCRPYAFEAADTRNQMLSTTFSRWWLFLIDDFLWPMTVLTHSHKHVFCVVIDHFLLSTAGFPKLLIDNFDDTRQNFASTKSHRQGKVIDYILPRLSTTDVINGNRMSHNPRVVQSGWSTGCHYGLP